MKRILLSTLVLAAMTSCANQEMIDTPQTQGLVPIDLNSGVQAVSRAAITTANFEFSIAGWEAATADYTTPVKWSTTATTAAGQKVAWKAGTQPYYGASDATKTHMLAWYPKGELTNNKVTFTESTGDTDVMIASAFGSKESPAQSISFAHKTTQFIFKVKAGESLPANTTLTSITIKNAGLASGFAFTASGIDVTYTTKDFAIPNITANLPIGIVEAQAGNMVMLAPINTKTFKIDVETNDGTFADVTVTSKDDTFIEGKAYTITLTFNQKIDVSSSVSAWTPGGEGEGTVE